MNRRMRKWMILGGWLCVWQILSLLCNNSIVIVGPLETAEAFVKVGLQEQFWETLSSSFVRISVGLLLGLVVGVVLAVVSYRYQLAEEICQPVMTLFKTIPVASFTVLLLIWWGTSCLAMGISFLVVLPQIYINTLAGLKDADPQLLEMAKVYRVPAWNSFFYIYRPALRPFLESGLKIAIGMAWKAGIAAEVIGPPNHSIGERLYLSKIYLNTADVLAWTAMAILLSVVTEKLVIRLLEHFWKWEPVCHRPGSVKGLSSHKVTKGAICLVIEKLCKRYGKEVIINNLNQVYRTGEIYYFSTPSGSGKTTLFRLLAGLEKPNSGNIERNGSTVLMFQEDRLCRDYSAVKNVELVTGDAQAARQALMELLPGQVLDQPVSELSGGMCRRVALVRAMEAEGRCCLLDEPFTGLDDESAKRAAMYIAERGREKAVLIATHNGAAFPENYSKTKYKEGMG